MGCMPVVSGTARPVASSSTRVTAVAAAPAQATPTRLSGTGRAPVPAGWSVGAPAPEAVPRWSVFLRAASGCGVFVSFCRACGASTSGSKGRCSSDESFVDRSSCVPGYDQNRISHMEGRLACGPTTGGAQAIADLEMLADLYLQADSYVPALETIDRLLALPESRTLSSSRRAVLESKAVSCRLARGDCQGAMGHCRELLRDEREIESLPLRSRLHLQLAEALFGLGRLEESRESAERCLSLAGDHGELGLTAESLDMLGRVAYRKGDPARARDCYEQAFALFRRVGDEASSALVRNNLGLIHKNLCEWETAASHFIAALEIHRRHGRYAKTASALLNLGVVQQKSGHWASAAESFTQAHQVCLEVGDDLGLTRALIGLGNLARLERRFEEAERLLLAALEKARARALEREGVLATEFLGELDFDRGVPESALARYDQALPAARRIAPDGDLVVELERRRGEALCALGRLDEAERACRDARRLAEHSEDRLEHAIAHRVAAALALRRGRREG